MEHQLQHAPQAALAADEADRDAKVLVEAPGGARPGAAEGLALGLVVQGRKEFGDVRPHPLGAEVKVPGKDDPLDAGGQQPVQGPVQLRVHLPVVLFATQGDDPQTAIVLGVDVELRPLRTVQPVEDLRVPGRSGHGRRQALPGLDPGDDALPALGADQGQDAAAKLGAQLADAVEAGQGRPPLVQQQGRRLEQGAEEARLQGLLRRRIQGPVHQGAEVIRRIPVGALVLAPHQGRGRLEEGTIDPGEVIQAGPGQEGRPPAADGVVGAEGVGPQPPADELVQFPVGQVAGLVGGGPGQGQAAEEHVQDEGPAVRHRNRHQTQGPEQAGDGGVRRLDALEHLVDGMGKAGVGDADTELGPREAGGDGADGDPGKGLAEQAVMGALERQVLGDGLQQKARLQAGQERWQPVAIVGQADDVAQHPVGPLRPQRGRQLAGLAGLGSAATGKVEGHQGHAPGLQARAELHQLAGADDAVGPGDDHAAARARRAKDLRHQVRRADGRPAVAEEVQDGPQPQGGEGRGAQGFGHGGSPRSAALVIATSQPVG